MIGKLKGIIDTIYDDHLILDVNGVGYRVFCTIKLLSKEVGSKIDILINTIVREDAILLFGFVDEIEKNWFEILCGVSGVGAKTALKILSSMTTADMIRAVDDENAKEFCKVPGIGQAGANKILAELKNKRKKLINDGGATSTTTIIIKEGDSRLKDALSALENLGYQRNVCYNILNEILGDRPEIVLESLITEALKKINNF
ncbi:MAG: Holliday junction branch migration protein RuvA [Rickettsiales bacterium]|nr:MAG: Holliday junction branch migration protein RuvA [Rickettsiales bacterium]